MLKGINKEQDERKNFEELIYIPKVLSLKSKK